MTAPGLEEGTPYPPVWRGRRESAMGKAWISWIYAFAEMTAHGIEMRGHTASRSWLSVKRRRSVARCDTREQQLFAKGATGMSATQ